MERRALTQRRLDPNAPAVHLDDLSRNGETEPRAAPGACVRAVNLAELLEYAFALFRGMPGPVSLTLTSKRPSAAQAVMRTSPASVNLMALPTRLSNS